MKLEFDDKLEPQRLKFGLLRWKNIHVELEFLRLEFYKTRSKRTKYEEEQRKKTKEERQADPKKN